MAWAYCEVPIEGDNPAFLADVSEISDNFCMEDWWSFLAADHVTSFKFGRQLQCGNQAASGDSAPHTTWCQTENNNQITNMHFAKDRTVDSMLGEAHNPICTLCAASMKAGARASSHHHHVASMPACTAPSAPLTWSCRLHLE